MSKEELIKTQADYIALQVASGRSVKGELADKKALQRTTLEYQDNLLVLSQLTGENVAEIKNKQKDPDEFTRNQKERKKISESNKGKTISLYFE